METLIRSYVQGGIEMPTPPASPPPPYHLRRLLCECIEGHVAFDGSSLAPAARFVQRLGQSGTEWYVENVPMLVLLLDFAPHLEAEF